MQTIKKYLVLFIIGLILTGCSVEVDLGKRNDSIVYMKDGIPKYTGKLYTVLNNNEPYFDKSDISTRAYENYSKLDKLKRAGRADSILGKETMPTQKRQSIRRVYPSGWKQKSYNFIKTKFLYNRSHLIGFQLSAENANRRNIITGTRTFNSEGMLPFENKVAEYIKRTNRHVRYRVTPIYVGDELVARGVIMEAWSIEDKGEAIRFNVFVHNIEPRVEIDYATGKSREVKKDK